ncbi:3-phosphoshikimate 1-carboxyvinyltransferase [Paenibacillus rigui]|uniref:3-phosphoshikimate 1-carboxyvinyltransferase n=1 Tax=Paenibacillus rigui TaxID=554312 RepID=A0A229UWQ7_9BACL|nr:3-phosphoshikimate 1-carboxyvinyltransferase [Paenibacillus rigui]OXM87575.1 3-phosphoshikimate 1-carboxyvinyltransferase [Paenibacillus rigui]
MKSLQHSPDREARSPWSRHNDKQRVTLSPPHARVEGVIRLAGSKSMTNRALIMAALAKGTSTIEGILQSDDSYWCIDCLTRLGVKVILEGATVLVEGCGGSWPIASGELYVGAAGTVARFLPGALAAGEGSWTLTGSRRMAERPMAPLLTALSHLGVRLAYERKELCLPFVLQSSGLQGGTVSLPGSTSSQFISGVLLSAPYAKAPLSVHIEGDVVQRDYVQMTLDMMGMFGVTPTVAEGGQRITVPTGGYQAGTIRLEPDVSACCYFWALAALTGGRIRIEGINRTSTCQPDIELLDVLDPMGSTVIRGEDFVEVAGTGQLKGGFQLSMQRMSDQTLTIAAMAPFADGPITLTDAAHIRHHECDRIAAVCKELRKLNIQVEEHADGLTVYPGRPEPAVLDSHDDHRMAMALSLIGTKVQGVQIADPGCVSKTCPDYFERLSALGIGVAYTEEPG